MKVLMIIAAIPLLMVACKKEEQPQPTQEPTSLVLVDSFTVVGNCQMIVYRSYYSYLKGHPHQVVDTKEVINLPCSNEKQNGKEKVY